MTFKKHPPRLRSLRRSSLQHNRLNLSILSAISRQEERGKVEVPRECVELKCSVREFYQKSRVLLGGSAVRLDFCNPMNFTLPKRTLLFTAAIILCATTARSQDTKTQLVILGTGTPIINPDRSGPSVAVVVNGSAYLVDFGPGVVRRAAAAARDKHIAELTPKNLKVVFATHLHSDPTAGLSDLYLTPAVE